MRELAHRRGRAGLAIALLAAAAVMPLRATAGWAESVDPAPGSLAGQAPPTPGSGAPEPLRVFTDARGRACRVYERRVMIEGTPSTALATICLEPSGRWVLSR
jgi:hypothetical protein